MRFFSTLFLLLLISPSAFAYLDPGSGSVIMTAILSALAAASLAIKTYWYKLKRLISGKTEAKETDGNTE
jgi:hypothetical protein